MKYVLEPPLWLLVRALSSRSYWLKTSSRLSENTRPVLPEAENFWCRLKTLTTRLILQHFFGPFWLLCAQQRPALHSKTSPRRRKHSVRIAVAALAKLIRAYHAGPSGCRGQRNTPRSLQKQRRSDAATATTATSLNVALIEDKTAARRGRVGDITAYRRRSSMAARPQARKRSRLTLCVGLAVGLALFFYLMSGSPTDLVDERTPDYGKAGWRYLTIVDAGSSGCRAHVFRWRPAPHGVDVDPRHPNLKVKPGLSTFESHPQDAGASLKPMLDFVLNEIPEDQWSSSPILLKATAGLRMVAEGPREQILESVRDALAASPLKFDDRKKGAKVIAGTDEGGYGWMSVNYLLGNLHGDAEPSDFVGVVEMGGASAQVTQIASKNVPEGYGFSFVMGTKTYKLYTHSYLGYGLEQAREKLSAELASNRKSVEDPCLNDGFTRPEPRNDVYDGHASLPVTGKGDAASCRKAIESALFSLRGSCAYQSCSFDPNAYQPSDLASGRLLAFENFYYTGQMLGVPRPDASPRDFGTAATRPAPCPGARCKRRTSRGTVRAKTRRTSSASRRRTLDLFLEKGVGVAPASTVKVMQQVGEHGIDWSLGAAISEASSLRAKEA